MAEHLPPLPSAQGETTFEQIRKLQAATAKPKTPEEIALDKRRGAEQSAADWDRTYDFRFKFELDEDGRPYPASTRTPQEQADARAKAEAEAKASGDVPDETPLTILEGSAKAPTKNSRATRSPKQARVKKGIENMHKDNVVRHAGAKTEIHNYPFISGVLKEVHGKRKRPKKLGKKALQAKIDAAKLKGT